VVAPRLGKAKGNVCKGSPSPIPAGRRVEIFEKVIIKGPYKLQPVFQQQTNYDYTPIGVPLITP